MPLNGKDFVIFVRGNQQHGVVGLQGASITCFTCEHSVNACEHVARITAAEQQLECEMPDFLVNFIAERNYQQSLLSSAATMHKERKLTAASKSKISFCLTPLQKQVFSALRISYKEGSCPILALYISLHPMTTLYFSKK